MMNLRNYAESHGKKNINIFVLIDIKRVIKAVTVFVMKAKTRIQNALQNKTFFIEQMLYSNKDGEDLEKLEKLVSLQNQVKVVRLQDILGKQNFQENLKKVVEPVTDTIKNPSEIFTKTVTEKSIKNNKAKEYLKNKLSKVMNDRGL